MKIFLTVCCCVAFAVAFAQPGISEMQQARQELSSSFFSLIDLAYVLALLFGLLGGLKIYHNWQMGNERIGVAVSAWFFAAFFMLAAAPFLKALFGI